MYRSRLLFLISLIVVFLMSSCGNKNQIERNTPPTVVAGLSSVETIAAPPTNIIGSGAEDGVLGLSSYQWKYNLETADHSCNLPASLVEISALGFIDGETMVAVNDEKGNLYFLDRSTCEVAQKVDFGKKGDYEGVEYVDGIIYVLKANGNIYPYDTKTKQSLATIKSALKTVNDVEGLGYDQETDMLVLACKGSPDLQDYRSTKDEKAFYGMDIKTQTLTKDPLWTITDEHLLQYYDTQLMDDSMSKKSIKKLRSRLSSFSPSAIAKHPIEGTFYILSSVGKLLVISSGAGEIRHVEFLDDTMCRQPEGIAFSQDGVMYISNEGKSFMGKIQGFDYKG